MPSTGGRSCQWLPQQPSPGSRGVRAKGGRPGGDGHAMAGAPSSGPVASSRRKRSTPPRTTAIVFVSQAATSFTLGPATPLSAVCIVPLYPGFLAFLSNQDKNAPSIAVLRVLVALGVTAFMATVGVVFTTIL